MTECQRQAKPERGGQHLSSLSSASPGAPAHTTCGGWAGRGNPSYPGSSRAALFRSGVLSGGSSAPPSVCEGHGPLHPGQSSCRPRVRAPGGTAGLGTKDLATDARAAPGSTARLGFCKLGDPGTVGTIPGYLRGHKRQIHGVAAGVAAAAAAARAPVLAAVAAVVAVAAAGPVTRTAIRERAQQRVLRPRRP